MDEINGKRVERAYEEFPVAFLTLDIKMWLSSMGTGNNRLLCPYKVSPLQSYIHDVRKHSEKNVLNKDDGYFIGFDQK